MNNNAATGEIRRPGGHELRNDLVKQLRRRVKGALQLKEHVSVIERHLQDLPIDPVLHDRFKGSEIGTFDLHGALAIEPCTLGRADIDCG